MKLISATFFLLLMLIFAALLCMIFCKSETNVKETCTNSETAATSTEKMTALDISNLYFNMRMDVYLRAKYPTLLRWQYQRIEECPCRQISLDVQIFFPDKPTRYENIRVQEVWNDSYNRIQGEASTEPQQPEGDEDTKKELSPEQQWIATHLPKILNQITDTKAKSKQVFILYPADGDVAFQNTICRLLTERLAYDISLKGNYFLINFQCDIETDLD